jgi:hypothetical protein
LTPKVSGYGYYSGYLPCLHKALAHILLTDFLQYR